MVALFAVGSHGNHPQARDGLRWPEFTATFGSVCGLGLAIEGNVSFFVEGILIASTRTGGAVRRRARISAVVIAAFTGR